MELKDLFRVPADGLTLLTDRPSRRLPRLGPLAAAVAFRSGLNMHRAKEREETAQREYSSERSTLLKAVELLTRRGIYGLEFSDTEPFIPLRIWWFRSVSWRVTDLRRFLRSRAFRSSTAARNTVTISWPMDVLGKRELEILENLFGPEFIDAAKVSISKDPFQKYSGAKRPPVGTRAVDGQWSIKTAEQWDDED